MSSLAKRPESFAAKRRILANPPADHPEIRRAAAAFDEARSHMATIDAEDASRPPGLDYDRWTESVYEPAQRSEDAAWEALSVAICDSGHQCVILDGRLIISGCYLPSFGGIGDQNRFALNFIDRALILDLGRAKGGEPR